jgi:hypothetical protein
VICWHERKVYTSFPETRYGLQYKFFSTTITSLHTDTFSIIIIIKRVSLCFNIVDCVSLDPKCRDVVAENMQFVTTCTYAVDVVPSPRPLTSIYAITHRFSETPMIQYREILEICIRYPHALSLCGVVRTANVNLVEISYGSGLGDLNRISGSVGRCLFSHWNSVQGMFLDAVRHQHILFCFIPQHARFSDTNHWK